MQSRQSETPNSSRSFGRAGGPQLAPQAATAGFAQFWQQPGAPPTLTPPKPFLTYLHDRIRGNILLHRIVPCINSEPAPASLPEAFGEVDKIAMPACRTGQWLPGLRHSGAGRPDRARGPQLASCCTQHGQGW